MSFENLREFRKDAENNTAPRKTPVNQFLGSLQLETRKVPLPRRIQITAPQKHLAGLESISPRSPIFNTSTLIAAVNDLLLASELSFGCINGV
jgi:hypothetical protein